MEILKAWLLPVVTGVIAGSITARYAPERLFKIVFVMRGLVRRGAAVCWRAKAGSSATSSRKGR